MNSPEQEPRQRQIPLTAIIMTALLVWGGYLAIGAVRAPGHHAMLKGLVVFGCTAVYLGFWLVALAWRRAELRQTDQ